MNQASSHIGNKIVTQEGANTPKKYNDYNCQGDHRSIDRPRTTKQRLHGTGVGRTAQWVAALQGVNDIADELRKTDISQRVNHKTENT